MEMLEIIHQNNKKIKEQIKLHEQMKQQQEEKEELEYQLEQEIGKRNNIMLFMGLVICTLITFLGLALGL